MASEERKYSSDDATEAFLHKESLSPQKCPFCNQKKGYYGIVSSYVVLGSTLLNILLAILLYKANHEIQGQKSPYGKSFLQ
jgi:hypothetical protein